jgi:hypothetical protein
MLKTPSDRSVFVIPKCTKRGGCVAAVNLRCKSLRSELRAHIEFLATLHCGALDCVRRGDCGCNAASLSEAISHELCCVWRARDLRGFRMIVGPATDFTVPREACLDVIAEICFERRRNTDAC